MEEILRLEGIGKSFPGVRALYDINCSIRSGEVLSVIGENGAGKSTLMKILSGAYQKDAGKIFLRGKEVEFHNPQESQAAGISIIYQELSQMPNLSIAENIFVGHAVNSGFLYNRKATEAQAQALLDRVGLNLKSRTLIRNLSIAQRQMVELAKAISFDAKVIIMDEPTSSLTENETEILMKIIDDLRRQDLAILFISHKLDEVLRISDRVMVLRDGEHIETMERKDCTQQRMINAIVGRSLTDLYPKVSVPIGETVLKVDHLSATAGNVTDVSFEVHAGEILGIYGLVGAGRSETAHAIFGTYPITGGSITINGTVLRHHSPKDSIRCGLGFVPEDRKNLGLILDMSVARNTSLVNLPAICGKLGTLQKKRETMLAEEYVQKLHTKTPSIAQKVNNLSGGNQQKVVLAKWLAANPRVLILDEPTRGIDIGAKREIFAIIEELAAQGVGILMISSEMPEVLGMSDRILVMHEGRLCGELSRADASEHAIMQLMYSGAKNG